MEIRACAAIAVLSLIGQVAVASTYLCVADAAGGVSSSKSNVMTSQIFNHNPLKYIHTNESGSWEVKPVGKDFPLIAECYSPDYCSRSSGTFYRFEDGTFTLLAFFGGGDGSVDSVVAMGRCSKIN